jgi:hypothetical protein
MDLIAYQFAQRPACTLSVGEIALLAVSVLGKGRCLQVHAVGMQRVANELHLRGLAPLLQVSLRTHPAYQPQF